MLCSIAALLVALQVRHIRWQQLCDASPCVRRMVHWTADGADDDDDEHGSQEQQPAAAGAAAAAQPDVAGNDTAGAAADPAADASAGAGAGSASSPVLASGRWHVLGRYHCWPLSKLVRGQLAAEHRAWLRALGWPLRKQGRRARNRQQQLLQRDMVASIARKLARRPVAVGVTPALVSAAGLGPGSSAAARHHIAPRKLRVRPGSEPGAGVSAAAGAGARPGSRGGEGAGRQQRKRRVLLDEFSGSGGESDKEQQQVSGCSCLILDTVVVAICIRWRAEYNSCSLAAVPPDAVAAADLP
jgi:hypothetical protein